METVYQRHIQKLLQRRAFDILKKQRNEIIFEKLHFVCNNLGCLGWKFSPSNYHFFRLLQPRLIDTYFETPTRLKNHCCISSLFKEGIRKLLLTNEVNMYKAIDIIFRMKVYVVFVQLS